MLYSTAEFILLSIKKMTQAQLVPVTRHGFVTSCQRMQAGKLQKGLANELAWSFYFIPQPTPSPSTHQVSVSLSPIWTSHLPGFADP